MFTIKLMYGKTPELLMFVTMSPGGRDDQDQGELFEEVTEVVEPHGGSGRPKRSPKPNPKYIPDDYDLNYAGNKSRTRSRRSI
jgi:hypothetical protein